jgi:hypothetical protein
MNKRKIVNANVFPAPLAPEKPPRPPTSREMWSYALILPEEEEVRKTLREILTRLDSIEKRLDRIEKLLSGRSG